MSYTFEERMKNNAENEKLKSMFTIHHDTNPVPYKRTTQKQKFVDKGYKKYISWKSKVISEFIKEFGKLPYQMLTKDKKYYVCIMAYYKDKTHGDTDNVAKGINDAIFSKPLNDKYISGFYDFRYDKLNPRVEVFITDDIKDVIELIEGYL